MSSTTNTDVGSRSSSRATRYSHCATSSADEPRANLCWSTPHCDGKGVGARKVDESVGETASAACHARRVVNAPTAEPRPAVIGRPTAKPKAPPSAPPVAPTPS